MDILTQWNKELFLIFNRHYGVLADKLMLFFTATGNGIVLSAVLLIALAVFDRKRMLRIFLTG